MTTPREDAIAALRAAVMQSEVYWKEGDQSRAYVNLRDHVRAALAAAPETPDLHYYAPGEAPQWLREPYWVDLASPETTEALARALDEHWLEQEVDGNPAVAQCSCGGWTFDAQDGTHTVLEMGQHFAPFSRHCAEASLAAMRETGR